MRLGLMIPPQLDPRQLVPMAVRAEEQGFDFVACGEHVFFHGPVSNAFVTLAAAAGATRRIRLMTALTVLPIYPAALAAKMITTLDGVSDGRVEIGIGVGGEHPPEFEACGVPVRGAADAPTKHWRCSRRSSPASRCTSTEGTPRSTGKSWTRCRFSDRRPLSGSAVVERPPSAGPAATATAGCPTWSRPSRCTAAWPPRGPWLSTPAAQVETSQAECSAGPQWTQTGVGHVGRASKW